MNKTLLATLATGLLLSSAPAVAPVEAGTAIVRCKSHDGTLIYTDKACAIFDAKAAPLPGAVMTRIVRDETRHDDDVAPTLPAGAYAYADASLPLDGTDAAIPLEDAHARAIPIGRRAASSGCARTPTQLAMDLRGSLALGDINRVAESYDWVGMSTRQGERTMDRLQHLIGRPVVDSQYFDATIGSGGFADASELASNDDAPSGGSGMLQLTLGEGGDATVLDFNVRKYAGCYFIRY
jgi:hypothetical protein